MNPTDRRSARWLLSVNNTERLVNIIQDRPKFLKMVQMLLIEKNLIKSLLITDYKERNVASLKATFWNWCMTSFNLELIDHSRVNM